MRTILLIEDNDLNSDMLTRRLQRRGFKVINASDGQDGIDIAMREIPDLILMDLNLPLVDGWEATRRLKADRVTASIPIIALTAHVLPDDRDTALEAGCNDYDTKPIEFDRLLNKIHALL